MQFLQNLPISVKTALFAAGVLFLALGAMVALSTVSAFEAARDAGVAQAEDDVALTAAQMQAFVDEALVTAQTLAMAVSESAQAARDAGSAVDRAALTGLYRAALERHGDWFGTWVVMLPEALDGEDSRWTGKPGHDRAGIFTPYWVRDGASVTQDTNDPNYDVSEEYEAGYFTLGVRVGADGR